MVKALALATLGIILAAGAASAHGGAAEPIPRVNFSDLPSYSPNLVWHYRGRHATKWSRKNRVMHEPR